MERNPATHAGHDELLLARLFGGDLEGLELERARRLVASCDGCAAVLADFGAIAAAAAALPVPLRPRDFTIGAAQARTLRRRRVPVRPIGLRAIFGRLGPVRSLGASMAAAGVAGILAVGALAAVAQPSPGSTSFRQADVPAAAEGGSPASGGQAGGPEADWSAGAQPVPTSAPNAAQSAPPKDVTASGNNDLAAMSPSVAPVSDGQYGSQGGPETNGAPPPTQPDSGPPWPLVFGGLAAGGLVLLAAPAVGRRYSAGRR